MVLAGSLALTGRLVMMLVSLCRLRRGCSGAMMVAATWAGDLTGPEQRRDQEECGEDAGGATKEHDAV
jgi:hypothetical protein